MTQHISTKVPGVHEGFLPHPSLQSRNFRISTILFHKNVTGHMSLASHAASPLLGLQLCQGCPSTCSAPGVLHCSDLGRLPNCIFVGVLSSGALEQRGKRFLCPPHCPPHQVCCYRGNDSSISTPLCSLPLSLSSAMLEMLVRLLLVCAASTLHLGHITSQIGRAHV